MIVSSHSVFAVSADAIAVSSSDPAALAAIIAASYAALAASFTSFSALIAAAFFATSLDQGYEDSISYTLAYMYVSLIKQPELNYESLYLDHIKKIMDHVERA